MRFTIRACLPMALLGLVVAPSVRPASAQSTAQRDLERLSVSVPDERASYGDDPIQFGELRLPKGTDPHPLAVIIHGGCWVSNLADLRLMSPLADALTHAGIATWNIEYRRVDNSGGGWPGTFLDVGRAVDYVRVLATRHPIDLNRVVVIGHSAGGHLALWSAGRRHLSPTSPLYAKDPLSLAGVISLAGISDLKNYLGVSCGAPIKDLMGGTPSDLPERYREASPIEMLPLGVRQILFAGSRDTIVKPQLVTDYAAAASKAGDRVESMVIEEATHIDLISPSGPAWRSVLDAARRLVKKASN